MGKNYTPIDSMRIKEENKSFRILRYKFVSFSKKKKRKVNSTKLNSVGI